MVKASTAGGALVTVHVKVADPAAPSVSVAVTVAWYVPGVVGTVPETVPVLWSTARPGGRPAAV